MLSKETKSRIIKDARDYRTTVWNDTQPVLEITVEELKDSSLEDYVTGATAEATRYEKELKELREANDKLKLEIKSILKAVADGGNLFDKIKEWT